MPSPGPPPEADLLVAGSLKPREIKRLLQKRHGYTPQAVAKLMLKDELVEALVAEENAALARAGARAYAEEGGALGLFSLDRWERWYAGNTPLAVALLVALLTTVLFATPLYQTLNFQLSLWYDRRQHQCSRAYRAGSVVGVAGIFLLAALDAVKVWMRVTIGLGWVTPRRYYWRIIPYLIPIPNMSLSTDMLQGGGKGGGGGGGFGLNMAPMLLSWLISYAQRKVEDVVGLAIKRSEKAKRKAKRAKEKAEGGVGVGSRTRARTNTGSDYEGSGFDVMNDVD